MILRRSKIQILIFTLSFVFCALFLTGCKTTEQLNSNINNTQQTTAKNQKDNVTDIDNDLFLADQKLLDKCPDINLVDDLSELHQFRENSNFEDDEKIAWIHLSDVSRTCDIASGRLAVNIRLKFDAHLGPRSRIFDQDQPTVSYPYFIAITNIAGEIVDKEIHGISLSFESDQSHKEHYEGVRKILDITEDSDSGPYLVMLGFQLSPKELAFNQVHRGKLLAPQAGKKPDIKESSYRSSKSNNL